MKKIDKIFNKSKRLSINDNTKLVIMSDCHRGIRNKYDNFIQNESIYNYALKYYYIHDFIYIELGDGDEMWEVKNYKNIIKNNLDIFKKLKIFHDSNRLIMIYGNHDIEKKSPFILKKYFYNYYDETTKQNISLLENLTCYESLILCYKGHDIFLIHGHQVDIINSQFWGFTRFFIRYLWPLFERIGIKIFTSASKNHKASRLIEKKLNNWSIKNNKIIVCGHTHRAIFPKIGESLYFNDGGCIYPDGITSLEIEHGNITLIKWEEEINENNESTFKRTILDGKNQIISFFK